MIWVKVLNKWSNVYAGIRDLDPGHHIACDPLWNDRVSPNPWAGFQARPNNPFLQQLRTDMKAYILHESKLIPSWLTDNQGASATCWVFGSHTNPSLPACHPSSSQQSFSTNWFSRWKFTAALDPWLSPQAWEGGGVPWRLVGLLPHHCRKEAALAPWALERPFSLFLQQPIFVVVFRWDGMWSAFLFWSSSFMLKALNNWLIHLKVSI